MKSFLFSVISTFLISTALASDYPETILNYTRDIIAEQKNMAGDIWEACGNGGYLIRCEINFPNEEGKVLFLTSSVRFRSWIGIWNCYKVKNNDDLLPYSKTAIFTVDQLFMESGEKEATLFWIGAPDKFDQRLLPPDQRTQPIIRNNFKFPNIKETRIPATDAEIDKIIKSPDHLAIEAKFEAILIADYLKNPTREWSTFHIKNSALNGSGYFISKADEKRIQSLEDFTPEKAWIALEKLVKSKSNK